MKEDSVIFESSPTASWGTSYDTMGRRVGSGPVPRPVRFPAHLSWKLRLTFYDSLGLLEKVITLRRDGIEVDSDALTSGLATRGTIYHYDLFGRQQYLELPNGTWRREATIRLEDCGRCDN